MPTEDTAQKLAELVKTTQNKVTLIDQARSLINDLAKITPPSAQDIQNTYPFLYKILLECYPETSNNLEQKDLEQLLAQLDSLKEVTFNIPRAVVADTLYDELYKWVVENIGAKLLINCTSSTEIMSGVSISYEGRFTNLSLDKIIKEKVYA